VLFLQVRPTYSELNNTTEMKNRLQSALCNIRVSFFRRERDRTLNEMKISKRVMERQRETYRLPGRGFLPRIYRDTDDASGRTLVPLWYNVQTSRSQVTITAPPSRVKTRASAAGSVSERITQVMMPPALPVTHLLNLHRNPGPIGLSPLRSSQLDDMELSATRRKESVPKTAIGDKRNAHVKLRRTKTVFIAHK